MPLLLTKRKQQWISKYKPEIVKGAVISPNYGIAARYAGALDTLVHRMVMETNQRLNALYNSPVAIEYFAQDDSIASQARIITNMLIAKFQKMFEEAAPQLAFNFVEQSIHSAGHDVQKSIEQLTGGISIPASALTGDLQEIYKATITENVALIKSIPAKYLDEVQQAVMRSITGQEGKERLVAFLQRKGGVTYARAKFIALDQTRKANINFSKTRLINAGITEGEWIHVPSNYPRHTHELMAGKIFDLNVGLYDSAVKQYVLPGQLPGCRCKFRSVLTFMDKQTNAS